MKWSKKTTLVTGGAGFIGSQLARRLLLLKAEVVIFDNFSAGKRENIPKGCRVIKGDVRDREALGKIGHVDYVFNFGSPSSVILFKKDPVGCVESTICGFLNLVEWIKNVGAEKMIFPTSGSVYGSATSPQAEGDNVLPMNLYGISKFACEHISRIYSEEVKAVGLRIFAGYGPGEGHKGNFASPITLFLNSMIKDEKPVVYGNGMQSRDFVYIDDIIEAVIRAAERNICGVINVGSGRACTFNQVIEYINQFLDKRITPIYIDKPVNYLERTLADTKRMRKLLGIIPLNLAEGLKKYFEAVL